MRAKTIIIYIELHAKVKILQKYKLIILLMKIYIPHIKQIGLDFFQNQVLTPFSPTLFVLGTYI